MTQKLLDGYCKALNLLMVAALLAIATSPANAQGHQLDFPAALFELCHAHRLGLFT